MEETQNPAPENETAQTPLEHLLSLPNAPSLNQINEWKSAAPGHRLKLFALPPDGKQVCVLRALNGIEMKAITKSVPDNHDSPEQEMENKAVVMATLWTNLTKERKLDEMMLQAGPAGLPHTLFLVISELSSFYDPQVINQLSGDL